MPESKFPNLADMAARMANNHARATKAIDSLTEQVDQMIRATGEENWEDVERLGHQLAESSRNEGYRGISALAQHVADEAHRPDNTLATKRSVIRLIGLHGRTRRRSQTVPVD